MTIQSKFSATSSITKRYSGAPMNEPRNVILKNITLFWVKLDKPVDNYAGDAQQWEVQARVPAKRRSELEIYGKVKEQDDGTVSINFRKKSEKADGSPAQKVRCVDLSKQSIDPKTVGNGSVGNVMLMLKDYEIKHPKTGKVTKSGTSAMLSAIQVTDLVEYVAKASANFVDFDDEDEPSTPTKASPKKTSKKVDISDDDIPF